MNVLSVTLVSGIFLVSISALSQFCLPHLRKGRMYAQENSSLPSSEIQFAVNESLDAAKVCICWKHYAGLVLPSNVLMSVCQVYEHTHSSCQKFGTACAYY